MSTTGLWCVRADHEARWESGDIINIGFVGGAGFLVYVAGRRLLELAGPPAITDSLIPGQWKWEMQGV